MSKNLADNIVALRKKHGLSQEQFAEKIGVTRQAVSNWERRIATPDVETLDLIAKLFDTDLTAMVNGESTGTEKPRDTLRYRRVLLLASAALTAVHFVLAFSGRIPMFPVVIAPGVLLGISLLIHFVFLHTTAQNDFSIIAGFDKKSTHNRRERPVYGHCGWSRGRFYYRITTFEGRPWDARDPHKTTFMALKHAIRLSIWRKQKETPGVEKAPGVSSPQRKGYGELRFGVRPGHPRKAVTSISQAEALAHGLTHLHHLVFAAVLARELDWCAALQDAREDARPWGVVGIGLRSDVWVEVRRDDHRPAVLVTRVDDVVDMPHDVIGAAVRPQVVDDEEVILEEARLRVLALVERHRLDVGHDVLHAGLQRGEPEVDDPVGDCRGIERLTCAHLSPEEQPIHVIA